MQCKPLFATPCLSSYVAYEFAGSCSKMSGALARKNIEHYHIFLPGIPFVDAARNFLLTQFLSDFPDATDLFFLDDDIGFPEHKVLEFLEREEEIVCGAYPMKTDKGKQFPVVLKLEDGKPIHRNGLYQANAIPGGFLRIKRSAVEKLAKDCDTYAFAEQDRGPRAIFSVFDMGPLRGEYVGEDHYFSHKCFDKGIDIWIDPNIDFQHRGTKRWEGNFSPILLQWIAQEEAKS